MGAEFEKENAKTEMMQEIMDDAIDEGENEEEEYKIVSQVLDEIGISMGEEIPDAANLGALQHNEANATSPEKVPLAMGEGGGGGEEASDPALSELEARLNNLKR